MSKQQYIYLLYKTNTDTTHDNGQMHGFTAINSAMFTRDLTDGVDFFPLM